MEEDAAIIKAVRGDQSSDAAGPVSTFFLFIFYGVNAFVFFYNLVCRARTSRTGPARGLASAMFLHS